ncbi:DUF2490 domain-containing protein [Algibacter sp. PT7-4]|uniref:DUF2490 domain-containing protein n=1 Tax=Algibacter ulvanivorans TaxID=3400999 RepID=UPI003AAA5700
MKKIILILTIFSIYNITNAQVDECKTGAWYMYFFKHQFKDSQFGIQGDIQYRNWNLGGDLEQLLIRSGLTYKPKSANVLLTLGYGNITTGQFGDSNETSTESRIYQEALIPQKLGKRLYFTHRFRYEQRFVENQDFRTRYRYNLFLNIPLNNSALTEKTYYVALYNELFINGQTNIGDNREVELFDRNRTYLGLGYVLNPKMKIQLAWMNQKTVNLGKGQMQLSLHHSF